MIHGITPLLSGYLAALVGAGWSFRLLSLHLNQAVLLSVLCVSALPLTLLP